MGKEKKVLEKIQNEIGLVHIKMHDILDKILNLKSEAKNEESELSCEVIVAEMEKWLPKYFKDIKERLGKLEEAYTQFKQAVE